MSSNDRAFIVKHNLRSGKVIKEIYMSEDNAYRRADEINAEGKVAEIVRLEEVKECASIKAMRGEYDCVTDEGPEEREPIAEGDARYYRPVKESSENTNISSKTESIRRWNGPDANNIPAEWITMPASMYDEMRRDLNSYIGIATEFAAFKARWSAHETSDKDAALVNEISDRHGRINKLLYSGPTEIILGPMDADAAHRDRGLLLSMFPLQKTCSSVETILVPKPCAVCGEPNTVEHRCIVKVT